MLDDIKEERNKLRRVRIPANKYSAIRYSHGKNIRRYHDNKKIVYTEF